MKLFGAAAKVKVKVGLQTMQSAGGREAAGRGGRGVGALRGVHAAALFTV